MKNVRDTEAPVFSDLKTDGFGGELSGLDVIFDPKQNSRGPKALGSMAVFQLTCWDGEGTCLGQVCFEHFGTKQCALHCCTDCHTLVQSSSEARVIMLL